jgi:hypothetical protein
MMTSKIWKLLTLATSAALATSIASSTLPVAWAQQPHMREGLRLLRAARTELQAAVPDKGGHRELAIARVDEAINQTQEGIEAGR